MFVRVSCSLTALAQGTGSFEIRGSDCIGALDDELEENDICLQATLLADGFYGHLFVSKVDFDWYEIVLPAAGNLHVEAQFAHASGDIDIYLYDSCPGVIDVASSA
jgi:hypothetical protein